MTIKRVGIAAAALVLMTVSARGAEADGLLEEVRGLRRDLHAVAVVAQRTQLLVYRLHVQAEATRKAKERYDHANFNLENAQSNLERSAKRIKQMEENVRAETDRTTKRTYEIQLDHLKASHSEQEGWVPNLQVEVAEAEREYNSERVKLEELQARLDQLERQLEGLSASLVR